MSSSFRDGVLVVGLGAAAAETAMILFGEDPWLGAAAIWPVPLAGALAFGIAVRMGASRWWLAAIPLMLLPLVPFALLWSACKFGGDCL